MQPENITVNGKSVESVKKELTPVEQWDHLAFQVILNELVPNGYKKVKNGKYRGSEYAEVPKKAVVRTQKIAAQLIRGYRDMTKKQLSIKITEREEVITRKRSELATCLFFNFRKKYRLKEEISLFEFSIGTLEIAKNALETISIK